MRIRQIRLPLAMLCAFYVGQEIFAAIDLSASPGLVKIFPHGVVSKTQGAKSADAILGESFILKSETISVGAGAYAMVVFENGTAVHLAAKTRMSVEEFLIEPLLENQSSLMTVPRKSKTAIRLFEGEITADTQRLANYSPWIVVTDIGVITVSRNSDFRITYGLIDAKRDSGDFSISVIEGSALIETRDKKTWEIKKGYRLHAIQAATSAPSEAGNDVMSLKLEELEPESFEAIRGLLLRTAMIPGL